jgi:hypothetical protein
VGGSVLNAILLSLLLIFDQATMDLLEQDTGFAVQLILVQMSLIGSAGVMHRGLASAEGTFSCLLALGAVGAATFMRYEAWPAALPLAIFLLVDLFGEARASFFRRLGALVARAFSLTLIFGTAFVLCAAAMLTFDLPRFEWDRMTVQDVLLELATHPHNLALFGVVALAVPFWLLSGAHPAWVFGLALAAYGVTAQPLSCMANDWIIRVVLARYLLMVASGSVLCTGAPSVLAAPCIVALTPIAVYFYAYPVQEAAGAFTS